MDRSKLLKKREQITHRAEKSLAIVQKLKPYLHGTVAVYYPVKAEVDILTGLDYDKLVFPRVVGKDLEFAPGPLVPSHFGLLEPTAPALSMDQIDVFVVPMLAYHGLYRMGYGAGYYDRCLAHVHVPKIGVAFKQQEADFMIQAWDVPMDVILTEE